MKRWIAVSSQWWTRRRARRRLRRSRFPDRARLSSPSFRAAGTFFTENKDTERPELRQLRSRRAASTVNFNRYVGVEGEVSGALGVTQDLAVQRRHVELKTPHLLNYSGNLVVSAANHSSVVPYVTGGVGGLSLFEKQQPRHQRHRDVPHRQRRRRREVVRRPLGAARRLPLHRRAVEGRRAGVLRQETRYGHRVYGGVLINAAVRGRTW